jgi:hypothetical protein
MLEIIPIPNLTATDALALSKQMNNYLLRLKEVLEFELSSISTDNLAPELRRKLDALGANIKTINEVREDEMKQVSSNSLTIEDVLNSSLFKAELQSIKNQLDKMVNGQTLNGEDLNNVKYNYSGWITNCTNAPLEAGDGALEVVVSSNGGVMQRFTNVDSNTIEVRWYFASSKKWSEWTSNI